MTRELNDQTDRLTMLSRRSFLTGLAAVAGSLALDPFRYVVAEGRHYENLRLGLSAKLPAGWEFASIADFASLREHQKLIDELDDELHPLKDPDNLPIFIFEDPRLQEGDFVPAVALYDEALEGHPPADEPAGHAVMLAGFAACYRDLVIIDKPRHIDLAGAGGTWSKWSYTHEVDDDCYYLLICTVVVFRGERVHTFHLVDDLRSPRIANDIWDEFLGSIRYSTAV